MRLHSRQRDFEKFLRDLSTLAVRYRGYSTRKARSCLNSPTMAPAVDPRYPEETFVGFFDLPPTTK